MNPSRHQSHPPRRAATLILATALFLSHPIAATASSAWDFSVGAATVTQPIYPGADQSFLIPIPTFSASTQRGLWSLSASVLDGLDVTWFQPERRLIAGLNVNQGHERRSEIYSVFGIEKEHDDETLRLLEGSPDVSNPVNATLSLGLLSPVGLLRASAGYHPARIERDREESTRHGFLLGLSHIASKGLGRRWTVTTMAQIQFMDSGYADSWYTAEESNSVHTTFDADGGMHDIMGAAQVVYAINDRIDLTFLAAHSRLIGDAGASVYTTERGQNTAYVQIDYTF